MLINTIAVTKKLILSHPIKIYFLQNNIADLILLLKVRH